MSKYDKFLADGQSSPVVAVPHGFTPEGTFKLMAQIDMLTSVDMIRMSPEETAKVMQSAGEMVMWAAYLSIMVPSLQELSGLTDDEMIDQVHSETSRILRAVLRDFEPVTRK